MSFNKSPGSQESSEVYYTPKKLSSSQENSMDEESLELLLKKHKESKENGFDKETFHDIIVSLLNLDHLTVARFTRLIFAIAPKNDVSRKTLDHMFAKVLTLFRSQQKSHAKVKTCLHYICSLLKYKIIDRRDIRGQYPFYFNLIEIPELQVHASELIYWTTTYDNMKPWFVRKIENLYRKRVQKQDTHLLVLLQLFKRLKLKKSSVTLMDLPEISDETRVFPNMNQLLRKTLNCVVVVQENLVHEKPFPDSSENQILLRSNAYERYFQLFPQFRDLKDFLESYKRFSYDMYETCYDSLLGHKYNFVFIGLLNVEEKEQTKLYINHIWERIEQKEMSEEEIKKFLQNLYRINLIFDQNVYDVRENLSIFLKSHDFFRYSKEILQLASMIQYPSYDSFFNELLSILYKKFMCVASFKDIRIMSQIITALGNFLYNNYKVKSNTYTPACVFNLSDDFLTMPDIDLSLAEQATQHFCRILINVGHGDFLAMLTILQVFEKLNAAENLYKLNSTNVIPCEISHAFSISPNIIILDRFAALIHNTTILGEKQKLAEDHVGLVTVAKQAQDLYLFLFRRPLDTSFFQQIIVRHSNLYRKVLYVSNISRVYVLKHNLAFQHLTRLDSDGNLIEISSEIPVTRLWKVCPNLMTLLKTVKLASVPNPKTSSKEK